jgi:hypothetical protein
VLGRRRLNHPFLIGVNAFKVFYNGIREGSQISRQKLRPPDPETPILLGVRRTGDNQIRSLEIEIGVSADYFVGFVLSYYLVSIEGLNQTGGG